MGFAFINSLFIVVCSLVTLAALGIGARAQTGGPAAPSRADITAILDQQKPQSDKRAALEASANKAIPSKGSASDIFAAYLERIRAKQQLGQLQEAIFDLEAAIAATSRRCP